MKKYTDIIKDIKRARYACIDSETGKYPAYYIREV